MGFELYANNCDKAFYGGYGDFFNLRKNIAKCLDKEFGEHYETLVHCHTKQEYSDFDKKAIVIIAKNHLEENADILDFLFAPDAGGTLNYKTALKIARLLEGQEELKNKKFTYVAYSNGEDYEELRRFLNDCYSHRRNVHWR